MLLFIFFFYNYFIFFELDKEFPDTSSFGCFVIPMLSSYRRFLRFPIDSTIAIGVSIDILKVQFRPCSTVTFRVMYSFNLLCSESTDYVISQLYLCQSECSKYQTLSYTMPERIFIIFIVLLYCLH